MSLLALGLLVTACWGSGSDSSPSTGGGDDSDSHPNDKPPALLLDGDPVAGSKIFQDTCGTAICHGPDGSGGSTHARAFAICLK